MAVFKNTPRFAALGLIVLTVTLGATGGEIAAQSSKAEGPPRGFVCLARDGTEPRGAQHTVRVMVPRSEERKLSERGFSRSSCAKAKKWMQTTGPSMCALADLNDPAFVNQFLNTHGLTPAEICDLAGRLPG